MNCFGNLRHRDSVMHSRRTKKWYNIQVTLQCQKVHPQLNHMSNLTPNSQAVQWTEEQVNGTGTSHSGVHPAGQVAWTLQKASLFKRGRDSALQKYNSKMHDMTLTYNPNQWQKVVGEILEHWGVTVTELFTFWGMITASWLCISFFLEDAQGTT